MFYSELWWGGCRVSESVENGCGGIGANGQWDSSVISSPMKHDLFVFAAQIFIYQEFHYA